MPYSILVADGQPVVRAGLQRFLQGTSCRIVKEVATGRNLLTYLKRSRVDLALLGLELEDGSGLKTLRSLREYPSRPPVVVWLRDSSLTQLARARALGACGALYRSASRSDILKALKRAAGGKSLWTEEQLAQIGPQQKPQDLGVRLTQREFDVARQVAHGLPDREIAWALGISVDTIKEHMNHVRKKLGVKDRTKVALWMIREGWA